MKMKEMIEMDAKIRPLDYLNEQEKQDVEMFRKLAMNARTREELNTYKRALTRLLQLSYNRYKKQDEEKAEKEAMHA